MIYLEVRYKLCVNMTKNREIDSCYFPLRKTKKLCDFYANVIMQLKYKCFFCYLNSFLKEELSVSK